MITFAIIVSSLWAHLQTNAQIIPDKSCEIKLNISLVFIYGLDLPGIHWGCAASLPSSSSPANGSRTSGKQIVEFWPRAQITFFTFNIVFLSLSTSIGKSFRLGNKYHAKAPYENTIFITFLHSPSTHMEVKHISLFFITSWNLLRVTFELFSVRGKFFLKTVLRNLLCSRFEGENWTTNWWSQKWNSSVASHSFQTTALEDSRVMLKNYSGFQKRVSHVCWKAKRMNWVCTYIFMLKSCQNFNFAQCSLAIRLMLERRYFLDGDFCFCYGIVSGSAKRKKMRMN